MSSPIYIHSTSMGQADYAKLRVLKLCENADHDLGRTCIMRMYIQCQNYYNCIIMILTASPRTLGSSSHTSQLHISQPV